MNYRLLVATAVAVLSFNISASAQAADLSGDSLLASNITYPDATMPSPDRLIPAPGENSYFPMRHDGQPFILDIDNTINLTEPLNRFYYDPNWRGEVWGPFNCYSVGERAVRMMPTWPAYDAATYSRKLTGVHKFFEKWSGFGP